MGAVSRSCKSSHTVEQFDELSAFRAFCGCLRSARPTPPSCRNNGSGGVGDDIERVARAFGEENWREDFGSDRPKDKKKNQFAQGRVFIVMAESESSFHPKEQRRGGGDE